MKFTSNLLVRDQRTCFVCDQSCTFHSKKLFHLTGNEGFKCSCLDFSPRAAVVVPLDLLLSYRRNQFLQLLESCGKFLQFAPTWETRLVAEMLLRFPPLRGYQRRTNRHSSSRPEGAAPRTIFEASAVCQGQKSNMDLIILFQNIVNWF